MSLIDSIPANGVTPKAPGTPIAPPPSGGSLVNSIPMNGSGAKPTGTPIVQQVPTSIIPQPKVSFGMGGQSTPSIPTSGTPDTFSFVKDTIQAVPRDLTAIGVSLGQALATKVGVAPEKIATSVTPAKEFQWLLGDRPIEGLANTAAQYELNIKDSKFAQDNGLTQYATPLAVAGAVVPVALDFTGLGGEKSALKAIARSTDINEIATILRHAGVHEDLVGPAAFKLVGIKDTNEVADALTMISHLQSTTKAAEMGAARGAEKMGAPTEVLPPPRTDPTFSTMAHPDHSIEAQQIMRQIPEEHAALTPHIEQAALSKTFVDELGTHVATELGGTMKTAPIKGVDRILEKVPTYGGDFSKIKDYARGTILVDDPASALKRVHELDHPVGAAKENISTPLESGYRSIIQNVKSPNGQVVEMQATYPEIFAAKQREGDAIYRKFRTLAEGIENANRKPTATEIRQLEYLQSRSRTLYTNAYEAAVRRLNSSNVSERPLSPIAASGKEPLPPHLSVQEPSTNFLHGLDEKSNITPSSSTKPVGSPVDSGDTLDSAIRNDTVSQDGGKGKPPTDNEVGIASGDDANSPKNIEKKIVDQHFNAEKLNLTYEEEEGISKRIEALGLDTRSVKSFGEMRDAAEALGTDIQTLLKDVRSSRIKDDEVVALKNNINHNSQKLIALEEKINADPTNEALKRERDIAEYMINQSLKKLIKGGTEAGRAVAAFRILANRSMDPSYWYTKAARELDGKPFTDEMKKAINDLIGKADRQGLAEYIQMLRVPTFAEQATTLWKAGLLTSFTTHLANIGGNLTMGALMSASDVASAGLDVLAALITGKRTVVFAPSAIVAKAKGTAQGVKDAATYLKTGAYTQDMLTKYDLPRAPMFKNFILRNYTEAVFRSLGAEDIIFRQAAMSESMEKSALLMAKNEGLKGADATARVRYLLENPTNEMSVRAIDDAEYATFSNDNALSSAVASFKGSARGKKTIGGQVLTTVTEVTMPFVKTPTNVASRIIDFSPAGFIKAMVKFANPETRSQEALVKDLGRAITGTGVMAFGAYLYQHGLMTGNVPTSPKERAQFDSEGKQANSVYLFGQWRQLNKLSPLGNLLGLGAEFERLGQNKFGVDLAVSTAFAGAKALTDQTFLKGVSGALGAVTNPDQNATSYINSTVASIVPAIIGRTTTTIDPTRRVPDGVLEALQARMPFLSESLPAKRDVFGNAIQVAGGRLNLIDPFATTNANHNPLFAESTRLGVSIGNPATTISKTKLTNREYSALQIVRGKVLETALTELTSSDSYKKANVTQQQKEFEDTITAVNRAAYDQVFPALMIKRYQLPPDTHPDVLRTLLNELGSNTRFKGSDTETQGRVLKKLLQSTQ